MMPAVALPIVREQLRGATARLAAAGVETPRADAEWLLAGLLGVGRGALVLAMAEHLDPAVTARYEAAVRRRERREPLQRILGWDEFRGLRLELTAAVLVPRPETELLVEHALALLPPAHALDRDLVVLDVGTGSGCIACALASERPDVVVIATDRMADALAVARSNARRLGLAERIRCVAADLLQPIRAARVDLVVANPPYLPSRSLRRLEPEVRDHDPRAALDGGEDGLAFFRRLVAEARAVLRDRGAFVVETAGGNQAAAVAALAADAGFSNVGMRRDLNAIDRYVIARVERTRASAGFAGVIRAVEAPSDDIVRVDPTSDDVWGATAPFGA